MDNVLSHMALIYALYELTFIKPKYQSRLALPPFSPSMLRKDWTILPAPKIFSTVDMTDTIALNAGAVDLTHAERTDLDFFRIWTLQRPQK
jgi:hypothetical protein